jgi:hypothetical protein
MVKYLHVHEVREVVAQEKGGGRALILMVPPAELAEYHTVRCGAREFHTQFTVWTVAE